MVKKILGLDLGSNSIGWALLEESDGKLRKIVDIGSRIFIKAVEEKTPTPKNVKRRNARLTRRVLQRRSRRKKRLLAYLVTLNLLPPELQESYTPEILLNQLGDPYQLRAKGLDQALNPQELGRVLLHFVQRRGFLSNRKTLLGDMIDDPDVLTILNGRELIEDESVSIDSEETVFKQDIAKLKQTILSAGFRTLGEYLSSLDRHDCKRNRSMNGGHLRTDRQMYRDELQLIWEEQQKHHSVLTESVKDEIEQIIFYQRPIKFSPDAIGKCSLEPKRQRSRLARLECQRFRYLQDINNLQYFETQTQQWLSINSSDRQKLVLLFESDPNITFVKIRTTLGVDKRTELNLERGDKKLKGNLTACAIRQVIPEWDILSADIQQALVEDLLTIQKKSTLKKRLLEHWKFSAEKTILLCLLEFEPGHSNLSTKAINKLLPYLEQGQIYSTARVNAGYGYEVQNLIIQEKLDAPPKTSNPIVNKALHELKRLINAIVAEYGKPDAIRLEMARDLEMNSKRYAEHEKQQKANRKANEEAIAKFQELQQQHPHLYISSYPSKIDKIKYRLWQDQNYCCAYSGENISLSTLFSPDIEIDHILPYSESLDDSYMNKVVCLTSENRKKGQRTPKDAFGDDSEQWHQITQRVSHWHKRLTSKKNRFFMTALDVHQRDFINSQLNDTRYICRIAHDYLKSLGAEISVSKGITTAWVRHQWGLNTLLGETLEKERNDHRHHSIDAVVIACTDRRFYQSLVGIAKDLERQRSQLNMRDIHIDPPWATLRHDLQLALENMIVSHVPQRKLNGELHEVTGAGFIQGLGNVHRKNLDGNFTQIKKIIDPVVQELVAQHLRNYNNKPKEAFAGHNIVLHKDGRTPIKRVRILQSETNLDKLQKTKFGVRNAQGDVFKWLAYGNLHHVEILRAKDSGKYSGAFVTMMEASRRARGVGQSTQPVIQTDHGEGYEFIMALHINDIVSIEIADKRQYYRVQTLDSPNKRVKMRLHTAATLSNEQETLSDRDSTIPALMSANLILHKVNVLGKFMT